jgi:Tfp pilus assembly protein PilE
MGQQQLLLIVIGVIIVGIAIVVGIQLASTSAQSSNRDAVIADLNNIGAYAQQYYRKPTSMGGGGNSFTGWTIPPNLTKTGNGTYTATVGATVVTIVGTGNETGNDGTNKVKATAVVTPTNITVTVNN